MALVMAWRSTRLSRSSSSRSRSKPPRVIGVRCTDMAAPKPQLIVVLDPRSLESPPPLLARLGLLTLALDRGLLVIHPPLHLLKEPPFEHHLLEGLQGGLDLVAHDLDLRPGQARHRPRRCEVERYGRGGSDRSTVFIFARRRVPSATAIAIVPKAARDSSTRSPA